MSIQARLGDLSSHGGTIITAAFETFVNGLPVARMGDLHACPLHGITPIVTGSQNTLVEGLPTAHIGAITGCGAIIILGSPDTYIS